MAEPKGIPEEFMDWLKENYGWTEVTSWLIGQTRRNEWQTDPYYQYWVQTGGVSPQPGQQPTATQPTTQPQTVLSQELPDWMKQELDKVRSLDQLDQTLVSYVNSGVISRADAEAAAYEYAFKIDPYTFLGLDEDSKTYLGGFTSEKDLAQRVSQLGYDETVTADLMRGILGRDTKESLALRTVAQEAQLSREERAQNLTSALQYTYGNPLVTPEDLKGLAGKTGEDYLSGESDELIRKLEEINMRAQERGAGEEQAAQAIIRQGNRPQPQEPAWQRPPMPSLEETIDPFLKGTYGEGTKLRSFIESEIPDVVRETAQARREWWERMNPEPEPEVPTFASEQARMKGEQGYWQRVASTAPTSTVAGGTYFGPGGLAGIASQAYVDSMRNMTTLRPEDFPEYNSLQQGFAYDPRGPNREPPAGEDPLLTKLRGRDWLERYYRQPGTGTVSRLTPSVRF